MRDKFVACRVWNGYMKSANADPLIKDDFMGNFSSS